ncbi:hypothetical protein CspHIS471_0509200 [Cutaneotrichosporon sp. HIS471]|nr:hypothetical protein CspHIS471_0509200 [Cutaneotrichosporon sp. HIS471]
MQTHSDFLHRSPFITYTGSWLSLASYHSWVPDDSESGSFNFAFDGTDFAVYGGWDADTAAWIDIDGNSTWWHAERPSGPLPPDGHMMYSQTVPTGFHHVSVNLASGRMGLVKVVVGDGPIGPDTYPWEWWHLAFGASAMLLAATRIISRKRRTRADELTSCSEKA